MRKSITNRWLLNSFAVTVLLLASVFAFMTYSVKDYYYGGIEQAISGRSNELVNIFGSTGSTTQVQFVSRAVEYVENFPDKELMELMVFNKNGDVIITSTGFAPDSSQSVPDYDEAVKGSKSYAKWAGKLNSGEQALAVTRVIYSASGANVGAVRYVVSLEAANRKIFLATSSFVCLGMVILFLLVLSGSYFIRSIITPVRKISATANTIAQGDFNTKIEKLYDDEIGELCDAVNNMASELGAAEKLKNDFISSVSHELRTPLTAIKGWAETMQCSGADPVTAEKGLNVIVKETERLTGIVEELLDFSRIQSGRMVLMMDKIDIFAELDEAVYMLKDRAVSEGKHLIFNYADFVAPVIGDKNRLRQVFLNIIDNALKYTPSGGVVTVQIEKGTSSVVIIIADNGCGIAAEDLPRVKEKFFKANSTQRGSGIGLAVADEIVRLHKGTLNISSEENVGTTVTITLPLMDETALQQQI